MSPLKSCQSAATPLGGDEAADMDAIVAATR